MTGKEFEEKVCSTLAYKSKSGEFELGVETQHFANCDCGILEVFCLNLVSTDSKVLKICEGAKIPIFLERNFTVLKIRMWMDNLAFSVLDEILSALAERFGFEMPSQMSK
jgi:hypothetical protein